MSVEREVTALRPREAANLRTAIEQFKEDIAEGEKMLDVIPETQKDFEAGLALATRLQNAAKSIDGVRLTANKPHQDSIKTNNKLVKPITDQVEKMVRTIRANSDVFLQEQQKKQREAEEQARRIEEGRIKAQETRAAKGMAVKPVEDLAPVPRPVAFKQTTSAIVKKVWRFEITDYDQIPDRWKKEGWQLASLDGTKIRATKGEQDIPGIRVWSEDRAY
jgi:hypothetical protein